MLAESAYLFRHALLRDAAYQLQLPGDRARLHGIAFELIEALSGGRPPGLSPLDSEARAVPPHRCDEVDAGELHEGGGRTAERGVVLKRFLKSDLPPRGEG